MFKRLGKYIGAGAATAAMLVAGSVALADPPVVGPRGAEIAPRAAVRADARADARADVRADRIDRRAYRAPGDLGLRLGNIADHGLAIANLVTNSVFYNAGLRPGDYIVSIDGRRLTGPDQFDQYLYANGSGQPVTIVVWRNGVEQTIALQPNVLYVNDNGYNDIDDLAYFGVEFAPQYANELYISRVLPGTYAYRLGLRPGDVITDWGGRPVHTPQDFARMIHDEKPGRVAFDYSRGSQTLSANVDFNRQANQGPGDRTAQRVTRNYPPAETNRPQQNPPEVNRPNQNGPNAPREPMPTLNPPSNPREPTPTLNPPSNPREPIPTVTPPAPHEPNSGVNPPASNPPSAVNPPAPSNPRPAEPQGAAPQGTAPRGR